ncbi:4a-hydroxytetrahydrobiopterin dehydratase [Mangrovitalea sediminis]|uniref:4a-hydroxytetrahydrobiopterin dehydratase n=1 Tax=Mangrovitalea sediminis TaxID=1982043 RepID=UPI000BE5A425|nr:4a-hydroxytetrahydrobiopterin dehydratase [Mangrovitalea sediminis]
MSELQQETCEACRADAPRVTAADIAVLSQQVPNWQIRECDGVKRLERVFSFGDFADALAFTNKIGLLAETAQHHPAILTEWGRVTVTWWTHKIKGLHRNDFVMAAKTDALASGAPDSVSAVP